MTAAEIFRSRDMRLCALAVPADCALALVDELMACASVQFLDAAGGDPAFSRVYSNDFTAACTLESKLRQLRDFVARSDVSLPEPRGLEQRLTLADIEADVDAQLSELRALADTCARQRVGRDRLRDYVRLLGEGDRLFSQAPGGGSAAPRGPERASGAPSASSASGVSRAPVRDPEDPDISDNPEGEDAGPEAPLSPPRSAATRQEAFSIVCSVPAQQSELIQRQLFRGTRGNCVVSGYDLPPARPSEFDFDYTETRVLYDRFEEVSAALKRAPSRKLRKQLDAISAKLGAGEGREILVVYISSLSLRSLCLKTLENGGATVFDVAASPQRREEQLRGASADLLDAEKAYALSKVRLDALTSKCAEKLDAVSDYVAHSKAAYHTLNLFHRSEGSAVLSGVFWAPADALDYLHGCASSVSGRYPGLPPVVLTELPVFSAKYHNGTAPDPQEIAKCAERFPFLRNCQPEMLQAAPSSFRTDKFTRVYQAMVESYGSPTYKEINPAFFYLYQFPFTFSIMFGDIGHGVLNAVAAALMCIFEKRLSKVKSDLLELLFSGRYLILMMSVFSIITGVLYNDYFALAFDWFGSRYHWSSDDPLGASTRTFVGRAPESGSPAYPFGLDPYWHWGDNSMVFINSYKMKMAVIIGITQMIFGLILKLVNYVHMRKYFDLITCWIPEFCFMTGFFGYMVFAIVYKWLHSWPEGSNPPALTNMLIQMFLSIGSLSDEGHLFNDSDLQNRLQLALVFICLISVVWLALAKPVALIVRMKLGSRGKEKANKARKTSGAVKTATTTKTARNAETTPSAKKPHKRSTESSPSPAGLPREPSDGSARPEDIEAHAHARPTLKGAEEMRPSYEGSREDSHDAMHAARTVQETTAPPGPEKADEAKAGVGDIVVQQVIHTIEFVLGCISHTASYLRLWALSLAHSQLAEVFFDELMGMALDLRVTENEALNSVVMGVSMFIFYSAWFGASVVVLCLMEALSAYLHGLRLAWIEFNDKFFQAEGYQFDPLRAPEPSSLKASRALLLSD